MREFLCDHCQTPNTTHSHTKKYCSPQCAIKARTLRERKPPREIDCEHCHTHVITTIPQQRYCSEKCRDAAIHQRHGPDRIRRLALARYVLRFMEKRMPDQLAKLDKAFQETQKCS